MDRQGTDTGVRTALADLLPDLRAFARFLAGSRVEADDLVQETLARALQTSDSIGSAAEAKPWCFAILRNVFHEQLRKRRREETRLSQQAPEGSVQASQEASSDIRDLAQQLQTLSPLLREALVLVGAQGLSYEQASRVCGVPPGTVKARVSRARQQLARALDRVIE